MKKLNANDYSTSLEGTKYKLAHRRADHDKWNVSETTQHRHLVALLEREIAKLTKGATVETRPVAARTPRALRAHVNRRAKAHDDSHARARKGARAHG